MNKLNFSIICISFLLFGCNKAGNYKVAGLQNPQTISAMTDRIIIGTELMISNSTNRPFSIDSLSIEASVNGKPTGKLNNVPKKLRETLQQIDIPLMIVYSPTEVYGKTESELLSDFFRQQGIPSMAHFVGSVFIKDNKGEITELKVDNQININVTKVK